MRGIARKKDAAVLPSFGDQTVKAICRGADDPVRRTAHIGCDEGVHAIRLHHFVVALALQQHELPSAMISAAGDERGGPAWIAQHHRKVLQVGPGRNTGEIRKRDGTSHLRVNHEPRLVKLHVVEPDAERLAHKAVRAVARNGVARASRVARLSRLALSALRHLASAPEP